jgi:transposase
MVEGKMYYKIQELKSLGYSNRRPARELGIDRTTIKKYWDMNEVDFVQYKIQSKSREKMLDSYRTAIEVTLRSHPDIPASVVYDQLLEADKSFEPSKRSVRLYVANLREELGLPSQKTIRQFCEVEELPAGFQAQVDLGEQIMRDPYGKHIKIYIFAMVMSHSRFKFVCFQLTPFNADAFVMAHDLAFRFFGGRTTEIVYDQDRVLAVSENGGNILYTETFEAYKNYAGFSVRLCRGYDPQSKGKIEAVVKYVKYHFLKYRTFFGINELNSAGLAWLDRAANGQKHETTKLIPAIVFKEEVKYLKDVPTLSTPVLPSEAIIRPTNVVHYKQNRYRVHRGTYQPGRKARIEVVGDKLSLTDKETGELLAEHTIALNTVGKLVSLKTGLDRNRGTRNDEFKENVLEGFKGCSAAEDYVSRILKKFPRYNKEQLSMIRSLQRHYTVNELEVAVEYCIERDLYSADEFRATLIYFRGEEAPVECGSIKLPEKYSQVHVQIRPLSDYSRIMKGSSIL